MTVELPTPAVAMRLELRLQGGFAGKECVLLAGDSEAELVELQRFYPEDSNSLQVSLYLYNSYEQRLGFSYWLSVLMGLSVTDVLILP